MFEVIGVLRNRRIFIIKQFILIERIKSHHQSNKRKNLLSDRDASNSNQDKPCERQLKQLQRNIDKDQIQQLLLLKYLFIIVPQQTSYANERLLYFKKKFKELKNHKQNIRSRTTNRQNEYISQNNKYLQKLRGKVILKKFMTLT
ncbi:hypothetical protein pb186bvf_007953 [Paramecium bursaria]